MNPEPLRRRSLVPPAVIIILKASNLSKSEHLTNWFKWLTQLEKSYGRLLAGDLQCWVIVPSDIVLDYPFESTTLIQLIYIKPLQTELQAIQAALVNVNAFNNESGFGVLVYSDHLTNLMPGVESFVEECMFIRSITLERKALEGALQSTKDKNFLQWYNKNKSHVDDKKYDMSKFCVIYDRHTHIYQPQELFALPQDNPNTVQTQSERVHMYLFFYLLNSLIITHKFGSAIAYLGILIRDICVKGLTWFTILCYFFLQLVLKLFFGFFQVFGKMVKGIISRSYFRSFTPREDKFLEDFVTRITAKLDLFKILEFTEVSFQNSPRWFSGSDWGRGKFYPSPVDFMGERYFRFGLIEAPTDSNANNLLCGVKTIINSSNDTGDLFRLMAFQFKCNKVVFIESTYGFNLLHYDKRGMAYIIQTPRPKTIAALGGSLQVLLEYSFTKSTHGLPESRKNIPWFIFISLIDLIASTIGLYVIFRNMSFYGIFLPLMCITILVSLIYNYIVLYRMIEQKDKHFSKAGKSLTIFDRDHYALLYVVTYGLFPVVWYPMYILRFIVEVCLLCVPNRGRNQEY